MSERLSQNYASVNQTESPQDKKWYVSPYPNKKVGQIKLTLNNGKTYDYACRYPAAENNAAIVGYGYVFGTNTSYAPESVNTGCFGIVTGCFPSMAIKRNHAVEVDYLFGVDPDKKAISNCVKYLTLDVDQKYSFALRFNTDLEHVRPITYYIRTILAAASVLSFPSFASEESLEMAKAAVLKKRAVEEKVANWETCTQNHFDMDFYDTQVPYETKVLLDGKNVTSIDFLTKDYESVVNSDELTEYINKYSHLGAISIMLRGGFKNLMEAYLSVEPPIADYADEICSRLDGIGNQETFDLLKAYLSK